MAFDDPKFYWAIFSKLISYVDGNWVDICSILLALVIVTRQWLKKPADQRGPFVCRDMGVEFVNAASVFPLLLLTISIFSKQIIEALVSGSRITLSVAGGFALFALLEDRSPQVKKTVDQPEFVGPPKMQAANSPLASQKVVPIQQNSQRPARKRIKRR